MVEAAAPGWLEAWPHAASGYDVVEVHEVLPKECDQIPLGVE